VVFHCFSGDEAMARRCADEGYVLSFAGPVTFQNATRLRAAAKGVPAELLLVETDAPFLTPHPFRGRPNEPYCVPYTVRGLAEVRGDDPAALAEATAANAERVFRFADLSMLITRCDR
jgi:TatD DNase family protein